MHTQQRDGAFLEPFMASTAGVSYGSGLKAVSCANRLQNARQIIFLTSLPARSESHTCGGRQAALAYKLWSGMCHTPARPRGHRVLVGVMPRQSKVRHLFSPQRAHANMHMAACSWATGRSFEVRL